MDEFRTTARWVLGGAIALSALGALFGSGGSVLPILSRSVAALLSLAGALLVVSRTRHLGSEPTSVAPSSWLLAGLVLVAFVAGTAIAPVDPDDDHRADVDATPAADGAAAVSNVATNAVDDGEELGNTDELATDDGETDGETSADGAADSADRDLEIHHLDVGQADSTLIVTPANETILIDTGDWRRDGTEVVAYLEAADVDRVDHLVATHGHADHVGGHAAVIEHFETEGDGIGAAYDSGVPHTTETYEEYLDAVDEYDVELFEVREGDELPLEDDEVEASILNPPEADSGDDLHYNSVTLVVEFGEFRYLITGDTEERAERRLVEDREDELDADVYQAGHHGSNTSSTRRFVEAVDPEVALISSAYDSQYGHPHEEVLERFAAMDVETYWTGVHGDVVVRTNGTDVDVDPAEDFSTDAEDIQDEKPDRDDTESRVPPIVNVAAVRLFG